MRKGSNFERFGSRVNSAFPARRAKEAVLDPMLLPVRLDALPFAHGKAIRPGFRNRPRRSPWAANLRRSGRQLRC
jgi:hypothetical protein